MAYMLKMRYLEQSFPMNGDAYIDNTLKKKNVWTSGVCSMDPDK